MPAHRSHGRTKTEPWDGDIQDLPCIGSGTSGLVFQIDAGRVAKVSLGTARSIKDIETERKIYQRFRKEAPNCPQILCCLELDNPRGLVFECCQGTVRGRLRSQSSVPVGLVTKWARQAAGGLAIIHKCGVIQGDG
jgi:serine/threonine protein kinase